MPQNELTGGRYGIQAFSNRSRGAELEAATYLTSQFYKKNAHKPPGSSSVEKSRNLNLQYCDQHLFLSLPVFTQEHFLGGKH